MNTNLLGRQQTVHVQARQVPNPRRVRLIDEMNQFHALQANLCQLIQVGEDVRVDGSQRIAAEVQHVKVGQVLEEIGVQLLDAVRTEIEFVQKVQALKMSRREVLDKVVGQG